jgi:ribonuclease VapC
LQLVIAGRGSVTGFAEAEIVLRHYRITFHPFDELQLRVACDAALRFGKGRHKAALNFGDCFSYALARTQGLPLLYTGGDFALTDIQSA